METLRSTFKIKLGPFKNLVNLSKKTIFRSEFKLVNNNPRPKQYNKHTLNKDLVRFYRNVQLKAHFESSKQNDLLKLKSNSNWISDKLLSCVDSRRS